ncbi:hypothetical protein ACO0QE_003555 [Hanseniaspora vineae]
MYSSYTPHYQKSYTAFQEPQMNINQQIVLPPLNTMTTPPPPAAAAAAAAAAPPPPLSASSNSFSSFSSFAAFPENKFSANQDLKDVTRSMACRPTPRNSIASASGGKPYYQVTPKNSIVSLSGGLHSLPETPVKNYLFTPKHDSTKPPFLPTTPRAEPRLQPPLLMLLDVASSAKPLVPESTSPSFYHYECAKPLPLLPPLPQPSSSSSASSMNSFMSSSSSSSSSSITTSAAMPERRLTLPSLTWQSRDGNRVLEPAIELSTGTSHARSQETVCDTTTSQFSPNTSFVFNHVSSANISANTYSALSPHSSSLSPLSPTATTSTLYKTQKRYRAKTPKPVYKHALKKGYCEHCGETHTTEWRQGPYGLRTMCNACGTYYTKMIKNFEYSYKCSNLEACEKANLSVYYMKYHENKTGKTGRKEIFQVPYYDSDDDIREKNSKRADWKSQVAQFVPFEVDENYYKITDKTHDKNKVRIVRQRKTSCKTDAKTQ